MDKLPYAKPPSDEEEAEIQRQIAQDSDDWAMPAGAKALRRGRPPGWRKEQVTVRLDKDVLAALRSPEAKGWQTRMNALLREAVGLTTKPR
jgi:uncharacterized protein (DUF4415 family)